MVRRHLYTLIVKVPLLGECLHSRVLTEEPPAEKVLLVDGAVIMSLEHGGKHSRGICIARTR